MAFTEFCCRSGGSNLNAGTRTGDTTVPGTAAFKTYTSGTWVQATRTFTPAGGANPTTDGIAVGDFVSVYPDAATVSPYVARITTVGSTTFVTSSTAFSGTAPVDGSLVTSAKIGGAWKGPNGTEAFPFGFIDSNLTNVAGDRTRVNLENATGTATFPITAAMTHNKAGPMRFQGFTSAYQDGGKFIVDGGSPSASFNLLSFTTNFNEVFDAIFQNNGTTTGAATGVDCGSGVSRVTLVRVVANNIHGSGLLACATGATHFIECEAYLCNTSNTANKGGIVVPTNAPAVTLMRCILHDNAGSNNLGLGCGASFPGIINVNSCVFDTNGLHGILAAFTVGKLVVQNCDFYSNGTDGIRIATPGNGEYYFENSNFVSNGVYGIRVSGASLPYSGLVVNCGYHNNGTGTTNGFGTNIIETGPVTLGAVPYVDAPNGDFRINLASAKNSGRGNYTETATSYAGTVGFPDIGAAQHVDSGGGSSTVFVIGS